MATDTTTKHLIKVMHAKRAFFCHEDQTILDAALQAGLALPHSCRGGNCGSCMAQLRSGSCVYRTDVMPPGIREEQAEQGAVLLCQLLPRSPMTVDIPQVAGATAAPVVRLPCRVMAREQVAADVMKLLIQMPRSQPLQFSAGQYVDFVMPDGSRRSYSLACVPSATQPLEVHVRRVAGGAFSDLAFATSEHSSLLKLEGPFGEFGWRDSDSAAVLIAGGTGYAPIKALLMDHFRHTKAREIDFFWGGRDAQDLYERTELHALAERHNNFRFVPVIATPDAAHPEIAVGTPHAVAMEQMEQLADKMVYAAGPPAMIDALSPALLTAGVKADRLICDAFDYAR